MVDIKLLKSILKYKQEEIKLVCGAYLDFFEYDTQEGDGYLYGKGNIPVMLVAHMDTVHREKPTEIYYDSEQHIMWSPYGIGGDDRCGIYIILKLIQSGYRPHIMLLEDEEKGCIGATKMVEKLKCPDINFIIELDRRGRDDCVFYDCDNKEFKQYIQEFGFKEKIGSFTDICVISDEWDIASVNLSVGYESEHTLQEIINTEYLLETQEKVENILNADNNKYYKYDRKKYQIQSKTNNDYQYSNEDYWDDYGYYDENGEYHLYVD